MKNWDKILDDFARKCKGGAPDMTNPRHLALLRESLLKFGWKEFATNEFIGNLREGEKPDPKPKSARSLGDRELPDGAVLWTGPSGGRYFYFPADEESGKDEEGGKWKPKDVKEANQVSLDQPERQQRGRDLIDEQGFVGFHTISEETTNLYAHLKEDGMGKHKWNMGGAGGSYGESQTTEMANRMSRGDPPVPPPTEEEYIEEQVREICGNPKNKKTCKAIGGEEVLREWARIAYQGAKDQNDFINEVVEEHGQNPQPDGLPAHCQMNPEGEAALRHALDEALKKCSELSDETQRDDCIAHHKKQIDRLNKRKDTDTFSLWMDKNGNLVCTKITNKQSLGDMRFNTTVAKRNLNNRKAAEQLAEEHPELQGKLLAVQLGLQETDREAARISTSGNVEFNDEARSVLEEQRGRGVSVADEVPDSVLDSPEMEKYLNQMRELSGKSPVIRSIAKKLFPNKKWEDLTNRELVQVAERCVGLTEEEIIKICDDNGIEGNERNEALGLTAAGEKRKDQARLGEAYGDNVLGAPTKLLLKVGVATADVRGKTTTEVFKRGKLKSALDKRLKDWHDENPPFGQPGSPFADEEDYKRRKAKFRAQAKSDSLSELKQEDPKEYDRVIKAAAKVISKKTGVSEQDVIDIIENDNLKALEGVKEKRDETMEKAHQTKVTGMQKMDEDFVHDNPESFGLKPDATREEVQEHLRDNPEDKIATRVYVQSFMNEMHWLDYIDAENDYDTVENTGGMIIKPSHYRECLSEKTNYDPKEEPDPKPNKKWRDGLKKHLRDNMKLDPDSNSIKFKHGDTEVILGHDTYRNAGDGQKLEGKASKVLQECLEGKRKAEQQKRK
jgi:hypothetical protein